VSRPPSRLPTQDSSAADDASLALAARGGDQRALAALVLRYLPLARAARRRWFLAGADGDDVEQEALIGLCGAVRAFDPARGVTFAAFAEVCVASAVVSAVRRAARHKHGPLNHAVPLVPLDDGADPNERAAVADHAEEVADAAGFVATLGAVIPRLTPLEHEVLTLCAERWSHGEIGAHLGRHPKAVDNALRRIRRKVAADLDCPGPLSAARARPA